MTRSQVRVLICAGALFLFAGAAMAQTEPESGRKKPPPTEDDSRTSFLRWLHADVLWLPLEEGNRTFGLIGAHVTVMRLGRIEMYGPPGVILLRQNYGDRTVVRPGYTWGFSIRLADVRVPGTQRRVTLFGDLARVWTYGDHRNGMTLGGFSITFKR